MLWHEFIAGLLTNLKMSHQRKLVSSNFMQIPLSCTLERGQGREKAMQQLSTKQLIESYYQAFNQKDDDKFLSLLDEQVIHDINQGHREIGKAKFAAFMQVMHYHYEETIVELVVMVSENGKHAAAEFIVTGKYLKTVDGLPPANNQTYRLPVGAFFTVENQLITRVTNYYNLADWLKQVKDY